MENDQDTAVIDDPQTIDTSQQEPAPAELSEAEIANQTFSDVGKLDEPAKDDPKPDEPGEVDDPEGILVKKDQTEEDTPAPKEEEKPEPRKGSAEWYEARMAAKEAHIKNLEEDNYAYRQQRREAKLEQSRRQHEAQVNQLQDFELLTPEEENELIQENPEDYKNYLNQLNEYNSLKGEVGKENGHFTPAEHADFQLEEYDDFLKQSLKFDYAAEAKKDRAAADKRYEELNAMPEVIQMAEALTQYHPGKSGLYTARQMALLYAGVTKDQAVTTATINARKNLTNEINTTQERVTFDGLPKAEQGTVPKNIDDLTPEEIANMGPAELKVANDAIQSAIKKQTTKAKGEKTKSR